MCARNDAFQLCAAASAPKGGFQIQFQRSADSMPILLRSNSIGGPLPSNPVQTRLACFAAHSARFRRLWRHRSVRRRTVNRTHTCIKNTHNKKPSSPTYANGLHKKTPFNYRSRLCKCVRNGDATPSFKWSNQTVVCSRTSRCVCVCARCVLIPRPHPTTSVADRNVTESPACRHIRSIGGDG